MARTPNYNFERQERDRLKKLKIAEKALAKQKAATEAAEPAPTDESSEQN
jgi:hypothetical protein